MRCLPQMLRARGEHVTTPAAPDSEDIARCHDTESSTIGYPTLYRQRRSSVPGIDAVANINYGTPSRLSVRNTVVCSL